MTDEWILPPNLPVPQDDGAADHLPGARMPALSLPSTAGDTVRLDELGDGLTVIFIYPLTGLPGIDVPEGWDAIPGARGCNAEACSFRDRHQDLLQAGATRVLGLSSQDSDYQRELIGRLELPYAILSDTELRLGSELNLPTFEANDMTLYKRLTLVVENGQVSSVFYPIFPPNEHADEVLAWLGSHRPSSGP